MGARGPAAKWTQEKLTWAFKKLTERLGTRPTLKQWLEDAQTPNNVSFRREFGSWNNFVKAMGYEPIKPNLSEVARRNAAKAHRGRRSFNWKGGKVRDAAGYVKVYKPDHPNAQKENGYVFEHRVVMSESLGRPLRSHEYVHHRNAVKDDNRIQNLELVTKTTHRGIVVCPYCEKEISIK